MSNEFNPPLEIGDRVVCFEMEGEMGVRPGTKGFVKKIQKDPIIPDAVMYYVNWDNGSQLPLLSDTDVWKKDKKHIKEQSGDQLLDIFKKNKFLFKNFDLEFFRDFLIQLRNSGIVNMFGSSPLIYAGRDHIERYYGEGREDDEEFQKLLDMADESRDKLIQGIMSYLSSKNEDLSFDEIDMNKVNSLAREISKNLLLIYMNTF